VDEEMPIILEKFMTPLYKDLLNVNFDSYQEIVGFIKKYVHSYYLNKLSNPDLVCSFYEVSTLIKYTDGNSSNTEIILVFKSLVGEIEDYYWFLMEEVNSNTYKRFIKYEKSAIENILNIISRDIKALIDYVPGINLLLIILTAFHLLLVYFNIIEKFSKKTYIFIGIWAFFSTLLFLLINYIIVLYYKKKLKKKRSIPYIRYKANIIDRVTEMKNKQSEQLKLQSESNVLLEQFNKKSREFSKIIEIDDPNDEEEKKKLREELDILSDKLDEIHQKQEMSYQLFNEDHVYALLKEIKKRKKF